MLLIRRIKSKITNISENNKEVIFNILGAFIVRGGALIVSLFTMPAYIRYFNNKQILGLWFTILSVLSWILTFDLGIGNGLRNHLVPALVEKDQDRIKKFISSAYVIIGAVVFFSIALSIVVFRFINWNIIFNIPDNVVSKRTLNITVVIVFSGIMLQFLFKLITSILYAMQRSALNNALNLLSSLITLIYVTFAKSSDISTNLISLAIVHVFAVNLPLLLATIIVFTEKLKGCRPQIKYYKREYAKDIIVLGGVFFWVQIMYMIITTTNEFLITWLTGTEMVVEYQIYNKLFTLIGTIFTLALTPIWSAITKALAERNYIWIRKLYRILKLMAFLTIMCEFAIIPFLQYIINIWLGDEAIRVNYFYAFVFAVSGSALIWNSVISSIANGFGELKTQSVFFTIGAIIKVPVAMIFVTLFDSWIGVIMASIAAMSLYCIIQPFWLNKFLKRKEFGDEIYVQR